MTRRLEADLLTAGEDIVRVLPKLMAHIRDSARTYGKSDALAVARAALREPDLPVARLDGIERDIRLLVDHREALARERTTLVDRLRWYLPELDPATEITTRGFRRLKAYALVDLQLADKTGTMMGAWLARYAALGRPLHEAAIIAVHPSKIGRASCRERV